VRIYWRLQGAREKPVLVLLNSIGTEQGLYDQAAPYLLRDFRLLRVDTRGHGASDAPAIDYSLDMLAGDVLAALDAAGIVRASVCGTSLGGMIAMALAMKAPDRVSGLVLACTSAAMDRAFWIQRIATVRADGISAVAEPALRIMFSEAFARDNPAAVDTVRGALLTTNVDGYLGCAAAMRDMDLLSRLPRVHTPTLVLAGALDTATSFEGHGDRIVAAIPGAQAKVLPTGHLACIEDPAAFSAAVAEFASPSVLQAQPG
jgi:3-oxoadipate enol-lactonase/4-carboxymuconolactone decarboxylase